MFPILLHLWKTNISFQFLFIAQPMVPKPLGDIGELAWRSYFTHCTIFSVACFSVSAASIQHNNMSGCLLFMQYTHLLNSAALSSHWNTENYLRLTISHFKTCLRISCRIYSSLKRSSKQKCYQHVSLCAVNSNCRWK